VAERSPFSEWSNTLNAKSLLILLSRLLINFWGILPWWRLRCRLRRSRYRLPRRPRCRSSTVRTEIRFSVYLFHTGLTFPIAQKCLVWRFVQDSHQQTRCHKNQKINPPFWPRHTYRLLFLRLNGYPLCLYHLYLSETGLFRGREKRTPRRIFLVRAGKKLLKSNGNLSRKEKAMEGQGSRFVFKKRVLDCRSDSIPRPNVLGISRLSYSYWSLGLFLWMVLESFPLCWETPFSHLGAGYAVFSCPCLCCLIAN